MTMPPVIKTSMQASQVQPASIESSESLLLKAVNLSFLSTFPRSWKSSSKCVVDQAAGAAATALHSGVLDCGPWHAGKEAMA